MSLQDTSDSECVLLDTCIVSYLSKPSDPRARAYAKHLEGKTIAISFITLGEIYSGLPKLGAKRRAEMEERLTIPVKLPFNDAVCRRYADLDGLKTATGSRRVMEINDRWIAACALAYNLTLVTHNRADFSDIPNLRIVYEDDNLDLFERNDSNSITL